MDALTFEQVLAVAAIVFLGALVFSTIGFGIGVTSIPLLLLLLDPQTSVVLINSVSLLLFGLVIWQTRRHIPYRRMLPFAAAGICGVPVGVFFLSSADTALLRIAIAALIIALTLLAVFNRRWALPESIPMGVGVGFAVSVMLNAFGVGGALMVLALLSRRFSQPSLRGSLSLYFLVVEGVGVALYGMAGLITPDRLLLIGVGAVPVALGFGAATLILRRMNERVFRNAVIATIIITSIAVLAREVSGL